MELVDLENYVNEVVQGKPIVLWNLELDTLRADLGEPYRHVSSESDTFLYLFAAAAAIWSCWTPCAPTWVGATSRCLQCGEHKHVPLWVPSYLVTPADKGDARKPSAVAMRSLAPALKVRTPAAAGLLGFPPKELQYRFLSGFTAVFYIRQRDYSKVRRDKSLSEETPAMFAEAFGMACPADLRASTVLSVPAVISVACNLLNTAVLNILAVGVGGAVHHQLQRGAVPGVPRPLAGQCSDCNCRLFTLLMIEALPSTLAGGILHPGQARV